MKCFGKAYGDRPHELCVSIGPCYHAECARDKKDKESAWMKDKVIKFLKLKYKKENYTPVGLKCGMSEDEFWSTHALEWMMESVYYRLTKELPQFIPHIAIAQFLE
jgi:hypothetical protein